MPAFMLADVAVTDMDAYRESGYLDAVPKLAAQFGGKYRARGGDMRQLEGDWQPVRMVIIEFPDMENALNFYNSADYAPYRKIRQELTESKVVLVDGV